MERWRRVRAWGSAHPLAFDGTLAVIFTAFNLVAVTEAPLVDEGVRFREPNALAYVLLVLGTFPILWRRSRPLPVLVVTSCGIVAYEALGFSTTPGPFGVLLALYTVASLCDRRRSLVGALIAAVGVGIVLTTARWAADTSEIVSNTIVFGTAWLLGDNVRTRRAHLQALEERAERAERAREMEARRAVAEERTRIARELHDVVAHSLSVMVVQAGAARRILGKDPNQATSALESIEGTGREAMGEMRRLLGVLREADQEQPFAPQPSVNRIGDLVEQFRQAGLATTMVVTGPERELPAGVELTIYRIVQEGLTNALKHAGPATAEVRLTYASDHVDVEVRDDGRGASTGGDGGGHGLLGIRERVDLFSGELRAGPQVGGGYAVRARLPVEEAVG
ncbi:MAG TPA: sensor histidine kinase [Aquihabitans sp.]|jgi:signal transduction histidine kinase|nr:sensor histidine kinase [Aquihabitans sp.]